MAHTSLSQLRAAAYDGVWQLDELDWILSSDQQVRTATYPKLGLTKSDGTPAESTIGWGIYVSSAWGDTIASRSTAAKQLRSDFNAWIEAFVESNQRLPTIVAEVKTWVLAWNPH
jgi:hypothetical protein